MQKRTKQLIYILTLTLAFGCSGRGVYDENKVPLTDILTLEVSFGDNDENVENSKFLVARPRAITADDTGNILVFDEKMVKVYDKNGIPKQIIGGPGQGPGEFDRVFWMTLGPGGYLTVFGTGEVNLFSPNFKFLKKTNFRQSETVEKVKKDGTYRTSVISNAFYIDQKSRMLELTCRVEDFGNQTGKEIVLVYENSSELTNISKFIVPFDAVKVLEGKNGSSAFMLDFPFYGELLWDLNSSNEVVYINTYEDVLASDEIGRYTININYLDPSKPDKQIVHEYERQLITSKETTEFTDLREYYDNFESLEEFVDDLLDKTEAIYYQKSISKIKTDGKFIFAFTNKLNDKEEIMADIFDSVTGEFINSAYFHKVPHLIKNGNAYYIISGDEETLPRIEMYKIDPKVYIK